MERPSHDALTDLYARDSFLRLSHTYLGSAITPDGGAAGLFYDVSGMKAFNDRYGYKEGDELLKQLASILRGVFTDALVARVESDHFAVLVGDKDLMKRLELTLAKFEELNRTRHVKVRVGVCPISTPDIDSVLIIDRAKLAADSIRSDPDRAYAFYDEAFARRVRMQRHVTDSIDEAIEQGWIKLYFQPVIRTLTNAVCGLEALARWEDPTYGMLSPADFIKPLEDSHLIHKLDSYMVRGVCAMYRERVNAGKPVVPVSINLSRLDFVSCDIHGIINEATRTYGVPHEMLNIEITESTFIQDADIISHVMSRFHESGHNVWMDDFGSGYSSLNVLKDYSFDELKLDMAFLSSFTEISRTIVSSTVAMAKRIGIHTLAEGVETLEQFEFLRSVGCEKAQGYFFGMPLPIEECMSLVRIHGLKVETPPWRRYFDAIGKIDFGGRDPLAIIEDNGAEFHIIYFNEACGSLLEQIGAKAIDQESVSAAFMRSNLAHRLRKELSRPLAPGDELSISHFESSFHIRIDLTGLARNGRIHAYQLTPTLLTHSVNSDDMQLMNITQAICSTCHDLQVLDLEQDTTTPIMGVDYLSNEYIIRSISRSMQTYARQELYPLDIERFLAFSNPQTMRERLDASAEGFVCDCFRSITRSGDYLWREYTICVLAEQSDEVILYSTNMAFDTPMKFSLEQDLSLENTQSVSTKNVLELIKYIYDGMDNPVSLADVETHEVLYLNPPARELYGVTDEELSAKPCYHTLRGEERACASCREQLLSGQQHEECSGFNHELNRYFNYKDTIIFADGRTLRLELSFDVNREQEAIFELAETDSLTGLLNRRGCDRTMSDALALYPEGTHAMIALDINDFKLFNDLYGHAAGDALLISAAHELREVFGEKCLVGRNGGDEFLALAINTSPEQAEEFVRGFAQTAHGFSYGGSNYRYSIAAGYAIYPDQTKSFVELCRMADRALYHVKTNPETWKCYEPQMEFETRTMLGFNLKDIALGMPGAILVYRADGGEEILFANDALVKMFECDDMDDFLKHVGHSFKTLVHPGDIDRVEESIWNQVTTNEEQLDYVDYRIITKSGKVKDIWDSGRLVESSYYGSVFYVFMYDKGTWEEVIAHQ